MTHVLSEHMHWQWFCITDEGIWRLMSSALSTVSYLCSVVQVDFFGHGGYFEWALTLATPS